MLLASQRHAVPPGSLQAQGQSLWSCGRGLAAPGDLVSIQRRSRPAARHPSGQSSPPRGGVGHEQGEGGQPGGLTFRVQGLDLQLQRGVLQVELAGGGDDLNAVDEVHDGIATQDLAGGCREEGTSAGGGPTPPPAPRRVGSLRLWQRLGVPNGPPKTGLEEPSHPLEPHWA